jgi:diadenosine tetraphosphate (Ap4A) HIT family hydrolase
MTDFRDDCTGCRISQDRGDPPGGIVRLSGGWILNHYRAAQGYLGWLVLQPCAHRDEIADLTESEASSLGLHVKRVDAALRSFWNTTFPDDPIERVYFVYFFESPFDLPAPPNYHLHLHAIPRTTRIGRELREQSGGGSSINAWEIYKLQRTGKIPERYERPSGDTWPAASELVNYLRRELAGPSRAS